MKLLPIGSVIQLNEGDVKLMILNRTPLYNKEGTIGYFDYSAVLYPIGQTDQQVFFFNQEDIKEVFHEGYIDEEEKNFKQNMRRKLRKFLIQNLILLINNCVTEFVLMASMTNSTFHQKD